MRREVGSLSNLHHSTGSSVLLNPQRETRKIGFRVQKGRHLELILDVTSPKVEGSTLGGRSGRATMHKKTLSLFPIVHSYKQGIEASPPQHHLSASVCIPKLQDQEVRNGPLGAKPFRVKRTAVGLHEGPELKKLQMSCPVVPKSVDEVLLFHRIMRKIVQDQELTFGGPVQPQESSTSSLLKKSIVSPYKQYTRIRGWQQTPGTGKLSQSKELFSMPSNKTPRAEQ